MKAAKLILLIATFVFVVFTIIPYGFNKPSFVSDAHSEGLFSPEVVSGQQGESSYLKSARTDAIEQGRILYSMLCHRCHSGDFALDSNLPSDRIHQVVKEMESKADIDLDPVQRSLIKGYLKAEIEKRSSSR